MIRQLREQIRKRPRLHALLAPTWIWYHRSVWRARNWITRHRPVSFRVGRSICYLQPFGQIAEAVYWNRFEQVELDFIAAYLRPGMKVIDSGANTGLYTIGASKLVGSSGSVHAFEPSTSSYELLLRNIELNGCDNVTTIQMALSSSAEDMVLREDPINPRLDGHRRVEHVHQVHDLVSTDEIVQCLTLDRYCATGELGVIDFIKLDVEGAELAVLQGAVGLLAITSELTLLLECNKNQRAVAELLTGYGYNFFVWDVEARMLQPESFDSVVRTDNIIVRRNPWKE